MAGMLPGVGVPTRRRNAYNNNREEVSFVEYSEPSLRRRTELLSTMDETALRARQRLEQKLSTFRISSRSGKPLADEIIGLDHRMSKKTARLGPKLSARLWQFKLNRTESQRKVCAVCLEDFEAKQQVMDLSCSHTYHSSCLLQWLQSQSHCPCCRTPVNC